MTCIHCNKFPRSPDGVYCRVCALAGIKRQQSHYAKPWWQWPAYDQDPDWHAYLSAVVDELQHDPDPELVLSCRPAGPAHLPAAAIRILHDDILVSSQGDHP